MKTIPIDDLVYQINEYEAQAAHFFTSAKEPMKDLEDVNYHLGRIRAYEELKQWINTNF